MALRRPPVIALLLLACAAAAVVFARPWRAAPVRERVNEKDGTVLVYVGGGTFTLGSDDADAYADERPSHPVTLGPCWMGRHPVTNAQYRRFITATGYGAGGDWWREYADRWGDAAPVVCVSWHDAVAYCRWAGLRLPTEAEWEVAARGPRSLRYPWGNDWDPERLVWGGNSEGRAPAVGSRPAGVSPAGCLDMAGLVWQWCSTKKKPYPYSTSDRREDGQGRDERVLRGGSWFNRDIPWFRASYRGKSNPPDCRMHTYGFRCAASP